MNYAVNQAKLKAEMVLKGYNITSLSEKMGISRNTLSAVINGKNPSYEFMCSVINTLGLDPKKASDIFFSQNLRNK